MTTTDTKKYTLEEIKELLVKADTVTPWPDSSTVEELIAAAPTIIAQLIEQVEELRKAYEDHEVEVEARVSDITDLNVEVCRLREQVETLQRERKELEVKNKFYNAVIGRASEFEQENEKLRAERDELIEEIDSLEGAIDECIPKYQFDDGTNDEAGLHERLEYAADDIKRLHKSIAERDQLLAARNEEQIHIEQLEVERDHYRTGYNKLRAELEAKTVEWENAKQANVILSAESERAQKRIKDLECQVYRLLHNEDIESDHIDIKDELRLAELAIKDLRAANERLKQRRVKCAQCDNGHAGLCDCWSRERLVQRNAHLLEVLREVDKNCEYYCAICDEVECTPDCKLAQALGGACPNIIPNTFIMCGEDGNYCSDACMERAAKDGEA